MFTRLEVLVYTKTMSLIKTPAQIENIRASGRILGAVLRKLREVAREGVSLLELDAFAKREIIEMGGKPAFLGYRPYGAKTAYPATLCTSVNDVIVHGKPTKYVLKSGDIVKLDLGVNFNGGITDAAVTVAIGKASKEALDLIKVTENALKEAIKVMTPKNTLGDIGYAIERTVSAKNFHIVDGLTGHGVGTEIHEDPTVYNFGKPGSGMRLKEGMVLAIEPMTSLTTSKIVQLRDDSYATADGSYSAHFEHTVLITNKGAEVLTL